MPITIIFDNADEARKTPVSGPRGYAQERQEIQSHTLTETQIAEGWRRFAEKNAEAIRKAAAAIRF